MDVILEAIQFNHTPNSATSDAFCIRRNEVEPVIIPEWRRGISFNPQDSPAAYARNEIAANAIHVKAKFRCSDPTVSSISVQAIDGRSRGANVLADLQSTPVTLIAGESDFVSLTMNSPSFRQPGIGVSDIVWRWQYSYNLSGWIDFATTTHRIYVVFALPTLPWQPNANDISNTQQPWTEVLEFACCWAASATTLPQAATLVTQRVNALGKGVVTYDNHHSGSTGFTLDAPPTFDCTDFLRLLRGQANHHGSGVNCDDCATFVASFANILGCGLSERQMVNDFPLHPHQRIGNSSLTLQSSFSHHTVAWTGECTEDDQVFDACVQLDSDECPANDPHPLFVPAGMRFGQVTEKLYRFRLTSDPSQCNPAGEPFHRRVGFIKFESNDDALPGIRSLLDQPQQRTMSTFKSLMSALSAGESFKPWKLLNADIILDTDSLIFAQSFLRHRDDAQMALRVDAYASPSPDDARHKVKKLLSRFQLLDIERLKHADFGDVVHTVPQRFVVLFARRQFVFQIRNVGKKVVSCEELARQIDEFIISHSEAHERESAG